MGKIKFVSNEGNFTARGYVLNEVYETGPRTESEKNPGKFYYHITGKNIAVAGLNEWETNLFLYFKFPSNSEEANQANAYLAILKGTPVTPAQVAPIVQSGTTIVSSNLAQELPTAVQPVVQTTPPQFGYELHTANQTQKITSAVIEKEVTKDILLAGLTNLDFQSLNLKLLKIDGKISLTIILDGMPPLAINSGDIAAASVLEKIVSTFSESAQIVSTIREWRKGLSELQAELAKESVDTKAKVDAKAKRIAKAKEVTVVETAIPNEPTTEEFHKVEEFPDKEELKPSADLGSPVFMDDSLDMPPVESETLEEEEPIEEGNGLDTDIDEFQLK